MPKKTKTPENLEVKSPRPRVEYYLDNPESIIGVLKDVGALNFEPYESGLFPASDLSDEAREQTGMGMAWFRDNAHVINSLLEYGNNEERQKGINGVKAILSSLRANQAIIDDVVSGKDGSQRLPVRVNGDTLENDSEPRVQNDSVGYQLWIVCRAASKGLLELSNEDLLLVKSLVNYLQKIEYWQDKDEGHWEEDYKVHASSIGVVIRGLIEAKEVLYGKEDPDETTNIDELINKGKDKIAQMIAFGRTQEDTDSDDSNRIDYPNVVNINQQISENMRRLRWDDRPFDASMLFLIEPLDVLTEFQSEQIALGVEQYLLRDRGIARYNGDTYWMAQFPSIMTVEERTRQAEGRTEDRNQKAMGVFLTETEAQWTLFDSILSRYWGRRYLDTDSQDPNRELYRNKQLFFLQRSLDQLEPQSDGKLKIPEAFYYNRNNDNSPLELIQNDHVPLLWSQANMMGAIDMFIKTSHSVPHAERAIGNTATL